MKPRPALFVPGMLIAATGVGAGDLLTASLAGSRHGFALLWAAWVGALLKWFLNEGIARWQMATGTTLVEGWVDRFGRWVRWPFLAYLLPWAFFTAGALASACGAAGAALLPIARDPDTSRRVWGIAHALLGAVLVWRGRFALFERLMAACTGLMVLGVVLTAPLLAPDWGAVAEGLLVPRVPPGGTAYTLGVLGGVGGTVTLLSYAYWIRERGRSGVRGMAECRLDLGGGYLLTAVFGMSMIVIGSRVAPGQGSGAALQLADQLATALGPGGKWIFLLGFWGAVFSSLLGVWQSVPYLFADFLSSIRSGVNGKGGGEQVRPLHPSRFPLPRIDRAFLVFLATVPLVLLWTSLERAQLLYAVFGAFFMPLLALALLVMNTRRAWVGPDFRSGWVTNLILLATLAFFAYVGAREAAGSLERALR